MRAWMIGWVLVLGCVGEAYVVAPDDGSPPDSARDSLDASQPDASELDASQPDADGHDAGETDARDASAPDGDLDAGGPDHPDAGEPDVGTDACMASEEHCNGRDDDCDSRVDEGVAAMSCGTSVGRCSTGTRMCAAGTFGTCEGETGPRAEGCDAVDDDCDGSTDEGVAPRACGSNVGRCVAGTRSCTRGAFGDCLGQTVPRAERCDGVDDDCDSRVDEGVAPRTCGTNVGTCRAGTRRCASGAFAACMGNVGPRTELDDGLDNDCDGVDDNGIPCESTIEGQQRAATNAERRRVGRSNLRCDRDLRRAARKYAQVICDTRMNPLSHTGPDGRTPTQRIEAEGVVWTVNSENLAMGYATPAAVTAAWMGSPSHRMNILDARFSRVGVGYVRCGGSYNHVWVQNFAN